MNLLVRYGFIVPRSGRVSLLRLDVVAEQYILVAQVQFAVGKDRVWPGEFLAAVGLLEAAALDVLLDRLSQNQSSNKE
jgi:hypothetical protein